MTAGSLLGTDLSLLVIPLTLQTRRAPQVGRCSVPRLGNYATDRFPTGEQPSVGRIAAPALIRFPGKATYLLA